MARPQKTQRQPKTQGYAIGQTQQQVLTGQGYNAAPNIGAIYPENTFVTVPSSGPFDRAWQGVQKRDLASSVFAAGRWVGVPAFGGGAALDVPNPLQVTRYQSGTTYMRGTLMGGQGPNTFGIPTAQSPSVTAPTAQPGLLKALKARLFG